VSRAAIRVGVLGAGTVGREVIRVLAEHPERLCAFDGAPLRLAGVAVRDLERARHAGIPAGLLTDAPAHLVASPDVDAIVELMGGDEPARTLISAALAAGKPVVTANKHVVAHHGPDLEAVARRHDVAFRFEAAVAGGIPVLSPLGADLAADAIERVRGIVNGTTNYILSGMAHDAGDYQAALADAQSRGYAEADPAGDVEGDDAVNKLVILARLAFGRWLAPASVVRRPPSVRGTGAPGISGVTGDDLAGAAALGLTIKLLASAHRSGEDIVAGVLPTAVSADGPFGRTDGVTNRIEIDAEPLGTFALSGPGAGGAATSSAILGDLVAIGRGLGSTWAGLPPAHGAAMLALDPTGGPRRWFAFVANRGPLPESGMDDLEVINLAGGAAIRTGELSLQDARVAIGSMLSAGDDATLYPIDD
jgi:homoserine dehydrogenase